MFLFYTILRDSGADQFWRGSKVKDEIKNTIHVCASSPTGCHRLDFSQKAARLPASLLRNRLLVAWSAQTGAGSVSGSGLLGLLHKRLQTSSGKNAFPMGKTFFVFMDFLLLRAF